MKGRERGRAGGVVVAGPSGGAGARPAVCECGELDETGERGVGAATLRPAVGLRLQNKNKQKQAAG